MKIPLFEIGDEIFYYNRWANEIQSGNIVNIRQQNLNWDYNIRYKIYSDFYYIHWIQENHIAKNKQSLDQYLT